MSNNFICGGNKHKYSHCYIYLPAEVFGLPETISVDGVELQIKTSFHICLVYVESLVERYSKDIEQKSLDLFCDFVKENDVSFIGSKNEFRFVIRESDNRKSLVVMVDISNLDKFFEKLRQELNVEIDTQPAHITLYTLELDEGIDLNGKKDLENMTEVVTEKVFERVKDIKVVA